MWTIIFHFLNFINICFFLIITFFFSPVTPWVIVTIDVTFILLSFIALISICLPMENYEAVSVSTLAFSIIFASFALIHLLSVILGKPIEWIMVYEWFKDFVYLTPK